MSGWKAGTGYGLNELVIEKSTQYAGEGNFMSGGAKIVHTRHRSGSPAPAFGRPKDFEGPFEWPILQVEVAFPRGREDLRERLSTRLQKVVDQFLSEQHLDVKPGEEQTDKVRVIQKTPEQHVHDSDYNLERELAREIRRERRERFPGDGGPEMSEVEFRAYLDRVRPRDPNKRCPVCGGPEHHFDCR